MRRRRQIIAGQCYEVCFRARVGIPFPPNDTINLIILSAMARANWDNKVIICDIIWMGNHPHLILISIDAERFSAFLAELEKTLTEDIKRLLGLDFLHLWEGRPTIARIGDAEKVMQRKAYLYANPSRAHLVDTIEHYPGVSSFQAFKKATSQPVDFSVSEDIPWIRLATIKPLGTRSLSPEQDRHYHKHLIGQAKTTHPLTFHPNAWMKCFGIKDSEVEAINKRIFEMILNSESLSRQERLAKGFSTFGINKLKAEPIMKPHIPKKKERKIFFLASTFETRLAMLNDFLAFDDQCTRCYQALRKGDTSISWPPGAFRPPMGILANALC